MTSEYGWISSVILILIENSRSCAGKRLCNDRLWLSPREFTTLKGIIERLQ